MTGASTYDAAKRLLALDVTTLITDIRLAIQRAHLVVRFIGSPEMGYYLTGYDERLSREAGTLRSQFVRSQSSLTNAWKPRAIRAEVRRPPMARKRFRVSRDGTAAAA